MLLLFSAIFIGLVYLYKIYYGVKWISTTQFAVEGSTPTNGLISSSLSLANALGLQASSSKQNTYDNNFFAQLLQSRRVIKESLMTEAVVNGKKDLLANHYITIYHWREGSLIHKAWNKIPNLKNFYFTQKPFDQFTPLEDSVMNVIYADIIENNLVVTYDATTPFNIATFNTRNRDYSRNILKVMTDKAANYYMDDVYDLNKKNLGIADNRVDSLGGELKKLDYKVASMHDVLNATTAQRGFVGVTSASRDQSLLSTQYSAAVNNVEMAKVTLLTAAPVLQIIDDPLFATQISYVQLYIVIIIGTLLGIFFGVIYLLVARAAKLSNQRIKERMEKMQQQKPDTAAA
ncbi:MAG: hypothetical protein ACHQD9_02775 [Chitinophagales bacterium]